MSQPSYSYIPDLLKQVQIPPDGTLSRTLHNDEQMKVVLFGFSAGQELSEHTSSMPAILHVLSGETRLKLGDDTVEAKTGDWIRMSAGLRHSVYAKTPLVLLLVLVKKEA